MQLDDRKVTFFGLFIWTLAALFFLYEFFLRTFIGTIADELIHSFHVTPVQLSIIGSAYYLTYSLMQIPVGLMTDRFGVRRLLMFATLTCVAGVFAFSFSHSFYMAVISRFLMGFGSSFGFICLLVLALNWFPQDNFGFFSGLSQFLGAIGPLIAGAPLVWVLQDAHDNWRLVLSGIGFFGVALAVFIAIFVRNHPKRLAYRTVFLERTDSLWQRLLRLLKNGQTWAIVFYSGFVYVSLVLLGAVWGTEYLEAKGFPQSTAAFIASLVWLGLAVGCPVFGFISDRIRRRKPIMVLCGGFGIFVSLAIIYWPAHHAFVFESLFFCLGVAGAGQSLAFATIAEHSERSLHATAMSLNNSMLMFFSTILVPAIGVIIEYSVHLSSGLTKTVYHPHDFVLGFLSMPLFYVVATLISMLGIKETYCRQQHELFKLSRDDVVARGFERLG